MNETAPVSPAKSAVMFGVLFGVIIILELVISYVSGIDPVTNPTFGIILNILNFLVLPIVFIVVTVNNFKKVNFGFISLGQCLKIGVSLCLIAGLIYALFNTVFMMIFPEYLENIMRSYRTVMLQNQPEMTAQQLEMALSMTRKTMQPAFMIPITLVMFSLIGLIYSLIIGLIVRKEKPQSF